MSSAAIETALRKSLTAAIKTHDVPVASALRSALAAIANAEAVDTTHTSKPTLGVGAREVPRRLLSVEEVRAIIRREIVEREEAAGEFERRGRAERASRLRIEASALRNLLAT